MKKIEEDVPGKLVTPRTSGHEAQPVQPSDHGNRLKDPYAIRAMERVKTKLRTRMVEIGKGS